MAHGIRSGTVLLDYPHRLGGHCGSGALRDLLEWAGLGWDGPPSEGLVFGLGGALSFTYLRVPGMSPPVYLVGRNATMELDLCRRLGIAVEQRETDDPDEGWRWVTAELDAGRPVMINADIAHLPYLRVKLSNTRHDIVVIGYDGRTGRVWVVDNDRVDVQELDIDQLRRARSAVGFPDPARHRTYPMTMPASLPDLHTAATDAAAAAALELRSGGDLSVGLPLPEAATLCAGTRGVADFVDDLHRWPDVLDPQSYTAAVASLPTFIDRAGTGGSLFRRLQATFCADVARLTGDETFAEVGATVAAAAEAWSSLAAACREDAGHTSISRRATSVVEAERAMVDALEVVGRR